jgi:hypothetical protein
MLRGGQVPQYLAPIISAIGVVVALFVAWRSVRESGLRRDDVLTWANDVIAALQSLLLICLLGDSQIDPATRRSKLTEIMFDTSILVERGRLFFRNRVIDDFGKEKEPAYRGYRPLILDPIVVAYQIAAGWNDADADTRVRMGIVAENVLKTFVSLAQKEVGRSRTASAATGQSGTGADLPCLIADIPADRLKKAGLLP